MSRTASASSIPPPYSADLDGVLSFADFSCAEDTLRKLEILRRRFCSSGDKNGIEYCRSVARLGRRRAESIGRNARVSLHKRLQKREMAEWFRIWLETPELFEDWLELRKQSEAFRKLQQLIPADRSPRNSPSHGLRA